MPNSITSESIQTARGRVSRAWEHIQDFNREASDFLMLNPYEAIPHIDLEGNQYVKSFRLDVRQAPPIHLSLVAGDAIHNLDSVLDNLWYGVLKRKFPNFVCKSSFEEKALPSLRNLSPELRELVCSLQPYNAGDKAHEHPLHILRSLSGGDKHETPILLGMADLRAYSYARWQVEDVEPIRDARNRGLQDKAEIVAFASTHLPSIQRLKLNVLFNVSFQTHGQGRPAGNLLMSLHDFVRDEVVAKFEPFLPQVSARPIS